MTSVPKPPPMDEKTRALKRHNAYRARHGAAPLKLDPKLSAHAQIHADRGVWEHAKDRPANEGENIAMGFNNPTDATDAFYNEVKLYDFNNPGFGHDTGHFTQLVWRGTQRLGIGIGRAQGMPFYVFRYSPPGNWLGEFPKNVLPLGTPVPQPPKPAANAAAKTRDVQQGQADDSVMQDDATPAAPIREEDLFYFDDPRPVDDAAPADDAAPVDGTAPVAAAAPADDTAVVDDSAVDPADCKVGQGVCRVCVHGPQRVSADVVPDAPEVADLASQPSKGAGDVAPQLVPQATKA